MIVGHLQGWLRTLQEADAADARRAEAIQAQGFRIGDGGQVSGWSNGRTRVEYTDARTGEILFAGEVSEAGDGWEDAWFHVDRLYDDVAPPEHPIDPSLPDSVQDFLEPFRRRVSNWALQACAYYSAKSRAQCRRE